ncbi:hypothetical protein XELAEV_18025182mg [Xenopus laevis]|uniref:Uncharacterized protein n=1 Tax=Xenopus laevis TaxID=8355 RepID=A0A974HLM2_XENLA|nr:hypothetical protein XELAEV_18025182mg [Xenopus laevis]
MHVVECILNKRITYNVGLGPHAVTGEPDSMGPKMTHESETSQCHINKLYKLQKKTHHLYKNNAFKEVIKTIFQWQVKHTINQAMNSDRTFR